MPLVTTLSGLASAVTKFTPSPVLLSLRSSAVCCAVLTGLLASEVLSTLPRLIIDFVMPETVPVKVGDASGAFSVSSSLSAACTVAAAMLPAGVFGVLVALMPSAVRLADGSPERAALTFVLFTVSAAASAALAVAISAWVVAIPAWVVAIPAWAVAVSLNPEASLRKASASNAEPEASKALAVEMPAWVVETPACVVAVPALVEASPALVVAVPALADASPALVVAVPSLRAAASALSEDSPA